MPLKEELMSIHPLTGVKSKPASQYEYGWAPLPTSFSARANKSFVKNRYIFPPFIKCTGRIRMETEGNLDRIFSLVSNPLRRRIIGFLSIKVPLTFSDLMEYCGLDVFKQCGMMDYHLKVLLKSQVLKKRVEGYELTEFGQRVAELLQISTKLRSWWKNCEPDGEILAIDALEDSIAPLDDQTTKIRRLITSLELCHHKAERHIEVIIEAIGSGGTSKGPGTRLPGQRHPVEDLWQNCYNILSAWCSGSPDEAIRLDVGGIPASELMSFIGDRTPLKVWQVQRIMDKVMSFLEPSFRYVEMVEYGEHYIEHSESRDLTMRALIHDTKDGKDAEITLASAIDHLEPCHWNFVGNLVIALRAIGGDLFSKKPFAACGRNIKSTPIRDRMKIVSNTLRAFCEGRDVSKDVDSNILRILGQKTPVKRWLAASLDKTIRSQLGL